MVVETGQNLYIGTRPRTEQTESLPMQYPGPSKYPGRHRRGNGSVMAPAGGGIGRK